MLPLSFVYVLGVILFLTLAFLFFASRKKRLGIGRSGGKFFVVNRRFVWENSGSLKGVVVKLRRINDNEKTSYSFDFPADHQSIEVIRKISNGDIVELCPISRAHGSPDILESHLAVKRLVPWH